MATENVNSPSSTYTHSGNATTNYGSSTSLLIGNNGTYTYNSFIQWTQASLPSNITVATLYIYVGSVISGTPNPTVERVTASWDENVVTYNTEPTVSDNLGNINLATTGWRTLAITTAVQNWQTGTWGSYGIKLSQGATNVADCNSDDGVNIPYLAITYTPSSGFMMFLSEAYDKGKKYFKNRSLWLPENEPLYI